MPKQQLNCDRASLYMRVLGPQAACLAPVLSRLHSSGERRLSGILKVRIAAGPITRLLLRLARMPQPGESVACRARIVPFQGGEEWRRCFDGHMRESRENADGRGLILVSFRRFRMRL